MSFALLPAWTLNSENVWAPSFFFQSKLFFPPKQRCVISCQGDKLGLYCALLCKWWLFAELSHSLSVFFPYYSVSAGTQHCDSYLKSLADPVHSNPSKLFEFQVRTIVLFNSASDLGVIKCFIIVKCNYYIYQRKIHVELKVKNKRAKGVL